jgi:site-specific recombinase XerC
MSTGGAPCPLTSIRPNWLRLRALCSMKPASRWLAFSLATRNIDIEDLSTERGHRTVTVLGKGHKLAVIPMPPRVGRAVDQAAGERIGGPVLLMSSGRRLDRHAATRIVRRLAKRAGITKHISPTMGSSRGQLVPILR